MFNGERAEFFSIRMNEATKKSNVTYWKCYSVAETSTSPGVTVLGVTESTLQITYRPGPACMPLPSTCREKKHIMEQQQNSSLRSYCLAMSQCAHSAQILGIWKWYKCF